MKNKDPKIPLIVDLDGTLIKTDLFFEAALIFVGQNFTNFFKMVFWFLKENRTHLKLELEKRIPLDAASLPYNKKVIQWLWEQKKQGREMILATGSPQKYSESLASHLGLFSKVFGVNKERPRLTGRNKARFLSDTFGSGKFDYIGNSFIDYPVWRQARQRTAAGAYFFVVKGARLMFGNILVIEEEPLLSKTKYLFQTILPRIVLDLSIWRFCLRALFFLLPVYLAGAYMYSFFGFFILFLIHLSAFLAGELKYLHRDRQTARERILTVIHPYSGLLGLVFFALALALSLLFLPWWNLIFCTLFFVMSFSLMREFYWLKETLLCLWLSLWSLILVFL